MSSTHGRQPLIQAHAFVANIDAVSDEAYIYVSDVYPPGN
jgi:hypothetical protein